MIAVEHSWALWLLAPWLIACVWFYRVQRKSVTWIHDNVAYRFRRTLTAYRPRTLVAHVVMLGVMGCLLVLAMSDVRFTSGSAVARGGGRVLFVLDASASMYAADLEPFANEEQAPPNRFERARQIATRLTELLPDYEFGLVSFSGEATTHLPLTADPLLVADALRFVELHNYYRASGSSLTEALDAVQRYVSEESSGLQVVLLGDGELPDPEDYDDALEAVAVRGIPVHAVTIGSTSGESRVIYDFRDVVAKLEEKRVLLEYHTRRVDEDYRDIADVTGGSFEVSRLDTPQDLAETIRTTPVRIAAESTPQHSLDVALFSLFTLLFITDALLLGYRAAPRARFRLYALGEQGEALEIDRGRVRVGASKWSRAATTITVSLLMGCSGDSWRAHIENERGIAYDALEQHGDAEPHYLRAIGYDVRPEIPLVNLGRSKTLVGAYSEAHEAFERALEREPFSFPAHMNDGVAMFQWGESIRDPRNCEVARTLELWERALLRFESAYELATSEADAVAAETNRDFVRERMNALEALRDAPPPECDPPPPPPDGGGGGHQEGDQEQDEEEDEQESEQEGEGEQPQQPPSGPGQAPPPPPGMSEEERQRIRQMIAELRGQTREEGKFFRQSQAEQFPQESWENPDAVLRP